MATILLSAAGAAIGGSIGGTVLGLSMATVGRFAGALIGRSIDQRLMGQGAEIVETGRVERLRLTGSGEGDPLAQVHGLLVEVAAALERRHDAKAVHHHDRMPQRDDGRLGEGVEPGQALDGRLGERRHESTRR